MSTDAKKTQLQLSLERVTDKEGMIQHVLSAMNGDLQKFATLIQEQDFSLGLLTEQICISAKEGEDYVANFHAKDMAYKQTLVKLGLSFVKLGLSAIHLDELVDIGANLAQLAEGAVGKIEEKLDGIVDNIGQSLIRSENYAIEQAELALLDPRGSNEMQASWIRYRNSLHKEAKTGINAVLEQSLNSDDFAWCTLLSCIENNPDGTPAKWVNAASKKAQAYVKEIYKALEKRTALITIVKDNALAQTEALTDYFKKSSLITYTKSHAKQKGMHAWLSTKLGRELSKTFPDIVYQHKLRPHFLGTRLRALRKKEEKAKADIILRAGPNLNSTKEKLFGELDCEQNQLQQALVTLLQQDLPIMIEQESSQIDLVESPALHRKKSGRYSFTEKFSLFSDNESRRADSMTSHDAKKKRRESLTLMPHDISEDAKPKSQKEKPVHSQSDSVLQAWDPSFHDEDLEQLQTEGQRRRSTSAARSRHSMYLPVVSESELHQVQTQDEDDLLYTKPLEEKGKTINGPGGEGCDI